MDSPDRVYQVDKVGSGLIIHSFGFPGETIAPKIGEQPLTWLEAQAILLAGHDQLPADKIPTGIGYPSVELNPLQRWQ